MEFYELAFIGVSLVLCVRVVYKGGQSQRYHGPLFESKLFKMLAVLLANEFVMSLVFYGIRHALSMKASSGDT